MYPSALLLRVILCTGKYSSKKIVKPYEYQSKVKIFKVSFVSKRSMYSIFFSGNKTWEYEVCVLRILFC